MADTLINGTRPSFVSLSVTLDGTEQPRGVFKSINYDVKQEPGVIYSKSRSEIVGYTPGQSNASGSFEMLVTEYNQFVEDLTNKGQVAVTAPTFSIQVSYSSNTIDTQTDRLIGVRISGVSAPNQGTEATSRICSFTFTQLVTNGVVVGGDTSVAQQFNANGQPLTPVVSDFWFGPVYEADSGEWYCPGFTGNTYSKEPWDAVLISVPFSGNEQPLTPGVCEVMVSKDRSVDKKKSAGTDGTRNTIHGINSAEGEIQVTIWTPQQYRMLLDLWDVLFPGPQKFTTTKTVTVGAPVTRSESFGSGDQNGIVFTTTRTIPQVQATRRVSTTQSKSIIRAFDVDHPKLKAHKVQSVVFVSGSGPDQGPTPLSRVFTMKWVEYLAPNSKVNSTTTPVASKASTLEPGGNYNPPGTFSENKGPA